MRGKHILPLIAAALLIGSLGLAGCRQPETSSPAQPEKAVQQMLPALGDGQSPLPTPATGGSPLPTPATGESPLPTPSTGASPAQP